MKAEKGKAFSRKLTSSFMSSCLERQYYLGKGEITRITAGLGKPGPYILDGPGIIQRDSVFLKKQGVLIFWKTEIREIKIIENFSD